MKFIPRNLLLSFGFSSTFFIVVVVVGFLLFGPQAAQAETLVSGDIPISTPTVWDLAGSPYILTGDIYGDVNVLAGASLTIQAGVEVRFNGGTKLIIRQNARINVQGTLDNRVIFTSNAASPNPGDWGGLHIWGNGRLDNSSTIRYAEFYYARGNTSGSGWPGAYDPQAALNISNASPLIQNSLFDRNFVGIAVSGRSNPVINNTRFFRNGCEPITFVPGSEPVFQDVILGSLADGLNNGVEALGLGRDWYNAVSPVENATIRNVPGIFRGSVAPANQITNIAYVLHAQFRVNNGIQLTIDPGVVIKMGSGCNPINHSIVVNAGGSIVINGTAAQPVVFTSIHDDSRGAPSNKDTNLNGSATLPNPGQWEGLHIWGNGRLDNSSTIQYAEFYYANGNSSSSGWPAFYDPRSALKIVNASPLIQNSLFDRNIVGIAVEGRSNPAINNTRFFRNSCVPITFIPGSEPVFQDVIFGSLADGLNNGFEALGLGRDWYNRIGPVENATIRRIDQIYRGSVMPENQITNIPYVLYSGINVGVQLTIDPGVVIKARQGCSQTMWQYIGISSGGSLISRGENCNVVSFTSIHDDTRGGDTNLNGSATIPAPDQNSGLSFGDGSSANITYTEFLYAGNALSMGSITASTSRAAFRNNNIGIYVASDKTPTLNFSEMDFAGNTQYAIRNDSTLLTINAKNLWWGDPTGPKHSSNPTGLGDRVSDRVDFGDVTFLPVIGWHPIKLEFFEQGGGAVITLSYSSVSTPKQIIPSSNLNTASDGSGSPGLNYECYDGINFDIFKSIGIDTSVNFNPADTTLGVNRAGGGDTFSCRWTGYVKLDYDEIYTFYTLSDDGVRLWIDDVPLIDNWTLHGTTENSAQFVKAIVSNYAKKPFGLCAPDKPYDLASTVYGPCSSVPIVDLTWTYNERTGSPQKGYRVEIDDENTFSDPVLWKSCDPALYCLKEGTTTPETFTIGTPTDGTISYGNTYYWRVKVFDQDLEESVWSDTQNFQTFPHAGPQVDRDYSPPKPSVNQPVNFTDTSICYDIFGSYDCISRASPAGAVTYCWDFDWHLGDIGCDSTNATTSFSYTTSGTYNVSQQVTDESGIMCGDFFNIDVEFSLPTWREIAPF